jgi:hypothetical protein
MGLQNYLMKAFVVEQMPEKQEVQQDPVYIPIPVPMSYFNDEADEEKINKPKNK